MMAVVPRLLIVLSVLLFLAAGLADAGIDESRAKAAATDLVRKKMSFDSSHQLRATRREDWEDDLFQLQVKIKGQIAKAAYFFEVTESGYFVLSPNEAVYVSTADGQRLWTVAVPVKEDAVYGLYGFPDGEAEFGRLLKGAEVAVRSDVDAEAAALLFFTTVKDPGGQMLVLNAKQLRRRVEDYFLSKLPESKAETRSAGWWRGFAAAKLSDQLGVKSSRSSDGFRVKLTHIRSVDSNSLQLVALDVRVNTVGACETAGAKIVYRPSGSQ